MRTYTFHSELPPEMVRARLKAHEQKRLEVINDGAVSVQFLKDGSFCLLCTSTKFFRNRRFSYPFYGTVEKEEGGSRIQGTFGIPVKYHLRVLAVLMVLITLAETLLGFWETPGFALKSLLISAIFIFFCLRLQNMHGDKEQKYPTLRFIENHLLHP